MSYLTSTFLEQSQGSFAAAASLRVDRRRSTQRAVCLGVSGTGSPSVAGTQTEMGNMIVSLDAVLQKGMIV